MNQSKAVKALPTLFPNHYKMKKLDRCFRPSFSAHSKRENSPSTGATSLMWRLKKMDWTISTVSLQCIC